MFRYAEMFAIAVDGAALKLQAGTQPVDAKTALGGVSRLGAHYRVAIAIVMRLRDSIASRIVARIVSSHPNFEYPY